MAEMSALLEHRIAARHGIVTVSELLADGLTTNHIARRVARGSLIRVHHGVLRLASAPDTFESRCAAACAADTELVITGPAAARLWEFRHVFVVDEPIALLAHDRTPVCRGVLLRRTNQLDATDWVDRADGIRVASPPRAWYDCARDVDDERFERLTEWVLDHHTTMPTLWHLARRMASRGRPGSARVNRVMSRRDDWQRPAGSGLEVRVFNALRRAGIAGLARQHPIRLPNGVTIHVDVAAPSIRWAVEVDHVTWHGGRFDAQQDKARDRGARRVGWQVERVTDQELRDDFAGAITDLVALYELRRAPTSGRTLAIS